ncbi:hypothetical protein FYJ27_10500 [Anaerosalibacter bizertensis]|uniref:Bypass of forespore C C-terminal domain-containing protein n=1 Tax=Anaerosalibacter bizertensis TaxID=932217 RepID=A0A844FJR0_9FIRM|nr:BofC C-terminal domain-containing protein [Anaerosalibacter bizertensis]MSS44136.1 hypothetical protein [Anaerosalibacter bizertensis]
MKKFSIFLISVLCVTIFLLSFVYGYYFTNRKITNKPNNTKNISKSKPNDLEIVKEDNVISPNTFVEKEINYSECGHVVTDTFKANDEIINKTEKDFRNYIKENYPNIKIIAFSTQKIVLREERNHLCPNHYVVGESEGKIAIFKINDSGEKILDKIFNDYPLSLLKEVDQQKLKDGIVVDNEEELSDVLENFIS